jgi:hypothetical protein
MAPMALGEWQGCGARNERGLQPYIGELPLLRGEGIDEYAVVRRPDLGRRAWQGDTIGPEGERRCSRPTSEGAAHGRGLGSPTSREARRSDRWSRAHLSVRVRRRPTWSSARGCSGARERGSSSTQFGLGPFDHDFHPNFELKCTKW